MLELQCVHCMHISPLQLYCMFSGSLACRVIFGKKDRSLNAHFTACCDLCILVLELITDCNFADLSAKPCNCCNERHPDENEALGMHWNFASLSHMELLFWPAAMIVERRLKHLCALDYKKLHAPAHIAATQTLNLPVCTQNDIDHRKKSLMYIAVWDNMLNFKLLWHLMPCGVHADFCQMQPVPAAVIWWTPRRHNLNQHSIQSATIAWQQLLHILHGWQTAIKI